jgi:hypothetical protein
MFKKVVVRAAAVAAAVVIAGAASAATVAGNWNLTTYNAGDPGLALQVNTTSGGFSQSGLGVGDYFVFPLFKIWTNEESVNDDDEVKKDIKVSFSFTQPVGVGDVTGKTYGIEGVLSWNPADWIETGKVEWDGPLYLPGLTVRLFDAAFNEGLFDLNEGWRKGAEIKAKITYTGAPAPIPLPPAALLLIGGIGSLGGLRFARRRRAA